MIRFCIKEHNALRPTTIRAKPDVCWDDFIEIRLCCLDEKARAPIIEYLKQDCAVVACFIQECVQYSGTYFVPISFALAIALIKAKIPVYRSTDAGFLHIGLDNCAPDTIPDTRDFYMNSEHLIH